LDQVFAKLQQEQILRIKIEAFSLDSISVKVHPDGLELKKNGSQAIGKSRGGWNTKIYLVAADARTAIIFACRPEKRTMLRWAGNLLELGPLPAEVPPVLDRAYESDETRQLVLELNMIRWFHPNRTAADLGITIANFTRNATRWGACFDC
jgi:hypothetical protein